MPERAVVTLRRVWPRFFAVAVGALVLAALATLLGFGAIARFAGTLAWFTAFAGAVLGVVFHARFEDEAEL